jgi:hypothetical protein
MPEIARLKGEIEAVAPHQSEKLQLTTPLSCWRRTCRLPPFWAMSRFAFK